MACALKWYLLVVLGSGLDRPFKIARFSPLNGPSMVDFARANPWQSDTKNLLKEQNAWGALAGPLAVPGPGSQARGFHWGCPALIGSDLRL